LSGARPSEPPLLLALDLDGTLVQSLHPIRPAVVAAIRRALDAGVRVTIATGRTFAGTLPFVRELGVTGPIVCYQGAAVVDSANGRFEYEVPLASAVALRIYHAAKAAAYHVQFYADDRFYVDERNEFVERYARISMTEPVVVASLPDAFAGRDSTKVNIITTLDRIGGCERLMREVCAGDAYVTRSNPEFVEMLDPRVDKGSALRFVARFHGVPMERVLAVGDSYNDVPLLRAAGFAVAMGSAPPDVRAEADAVVGDVEHDGVAEAIARFVVRET
jgi:Cof subfamily protein (haloacid dehalogenase superfamily)